MNLSDKIRKKSARIGVLGLGYVGLPLAMEFCRKNFHVTGFEVDHGRLASLQKGESYVLDVTSAELKRWSRAGRFSSSGKFEGLSSQDIIIICVQTPLRKTKEPDVSNIVACVREISKRLRKGQLIILESTTYPGATEEIILPVLQESGLHLGKDFFLAFSPERVDPSNRAYGIGNTPKVVGGAEPVSTRLAVEIYSYVVSSVVPVSSTKAAEVVKLLENSFRAVNIALVNEMAQICHTLGLNVWEVIDAAATKPFGFMPFYPGPGIGGHCIPKDPQLLAWKMRTMNFDPRFLMLASQINGRMPEYTVARIADVLNGARKPLNGSRILVVGTAYKPGVTDYRESPALDVMSLLLKAHASVSYHDPYVPTLQISGRKMSSVTLSDQALKRADCTVILTAHRDIDYARIVRLSRRIFDARNALGAMSSEKIARL